MTSHRTQEALTGVLIGTAVGDALGLPMEGLSARRQRRFFSPPARHRLISHFGMISDDTEHTFMLAQTLLEEPIDPIAFQRRFARRLRWWLLCLPAGVGFATLRAVMKLWVGVSPARSGVFSAGNGPAMRSALLGVYFMNDSEHRRDFVRASTQITHSDPKAEITALAVAETAAWMAVARHDTEVLLGSLEHLSEGDEWQALMKKLTIALAENQSVAAFAQNIGAIQGVSGYAFQTVPVAIYAALKHQDNFLTAVEEVIACGGDTDTVGAITGALVGTRVGVHGIPESWRNNIIEWPRSISLLQNIAEKLGKQSEDCVSLGPVRYFWPAILLRNIVFLVIVMGHGFRRILPPY